jgi:hypothetical protein
MDAPLASHSPVDTAESVQLTDESPGVTRSMYFHIGFEDVRRVTEEWDPHVFDVNVIERLEGCDK